jgi:hypothetical protein
VPGKELVDLPGQRDPPSHPERTATKKPTGKAQSSCQPGPLRRWAPGTASLRQFAYPTATGPVGEQSDHRPIPTASAQKSVVWARALFAFCLLCEVLPGRLFRIVQSEENRDVVAARGRYQPPPTSSIVKEKTVHF